METTFRDNGAIGALLDEYEKAVDELKYTINELSEMDLVKIMDLDTQDQDCRSIQSILNHVLRAGYNYIINCRNHLGENLDFYSNVSYTQISDYQSALDKMFEFNVIFFKDHPNVKLEEKDPNKKMLVSWGNRYDVEQMMEHAIVHVLRHRRQINRFLMKTRSDK